MSYARLLRMHHAKDWVGVEVLDAWNQGQVLHRYILVKKGEKIPENLPSGTLVQVPLGKVVTFSSVHGGLFCDLGCADQMAGICDVEYIQSDSLHQRLLDGRLTNAGSSMQIDSERMMSLRPDAFFVSPFENAGYGVLENMKVPLIECADYMENSALGRAEWVKFYGLLMGRETEAFKMFEEVEKDYLSLCEKVRSRVQRPSLLCDMKQGSAWYVPGGESYIGRLFTDAGANYLFEGKKQSGSIALSFESVYAKGRDADVWVVKYGNSSPLTYQKLAEENPLYTNFRPWKERKIYGCNTFYTPFYEEVPFHPNRLLRDMIKIFHPEIFPVDSLVYYHPLKD